MNHTNYILKKHFYFIILGSMIMMCAACKPSVQQHINIDHTPTLYPDYNSVTIPCNIAPLNFSTTAMDSLQWIEAKVITKDKQEYVFEGKNYVAFNPEKWREILEQNKGGELNIQVTETKNNTAYTYKPFKIFVAKEEIDPYLCYRLITPGYRIYSRMGIYCRNLTNFEQNTVVDNRLLNANCVNCHSFCKGNTDLAQFHVRGDLGSTIIKNGDELTVCKAVTEKFKLNCVYPYWHPSGDYIAYSQNNTVQTFHCGDPNRVEVFDMKSRVVVYDRKNNRLITSPELNDESTFTTEPAFSPDGKTLYYTTAEALNMDIETKNARYNICKIGFDAATAKFSGIVDTLVNVVKDSMTAAFPRPSYDGKYLLYTKFNYGQFAIWHTEADLWMLDLEKDTTFPLQKANSQDVESYHSWSQNSRWIVFESRRDDGFFTRAYIAYINDDGTAEKAFLLPQASPEDNRKLMYSFNVPEFATKEFVIDKGVLEGKIKSGEKLQFGY